MNIFDEHTAYQLRQIFSEKEWPKEFKDWIHEQIAYDLLDSWLETADEDTYKEKAREIVENTTYGYEDEDGEEMFDFYPEEDK